MLIHRKNSCCKTVSSSTTSGLGGLIISYQYKNTGFIDDLSDVCGVEIDASGYSLSITPGSTQSKIRVMYRALVRTSDEPYSRISFRVLYDISGGVSGELCSDASYGFPNRLSLYPDPLTSIYTVDTIHSPATTDKITYSLQYSIESNGGDVLTSIPIGVLESSANSIILEELNGSGTTGPSIWTKGPSNTIYYIGGQVGINTQADLQYILDISGRDLSFTETGAISNTMQDSSHTVFKMYNFRGGVINNFITADGSSNSVSVKGYTDISGKLAINRQTAEAILDIQQAEDADVSGNTNVISRGDAIKIRNSANTSDWIISCDSGASGSDLFILNENE